MCSSTPKMPAATEADKPAVMLTARDGMNGSQESGSQGRKQLRIDLNNSTTAYGSSLVIPT